MRLPAVLRSLTGRAACAALLPAVIPALAVYAPKALIVPLVLGAGSALLRWREIRPPPRALAPVAVWFAALVAWAALSAFWSIDPAQTALRVVKILAIGLCGLLALTVALRTEPAGRRIAAGSLVVGLMLLLAQAGVEIVTGGVITAIAHPRAGPSWAARAAYLSAAASLAAILLWPAALAAARRLSWVAGAALVAAGIVVIVSLKTGAALAALAGGALVFAFGRLAPKATAAALAAGMAAFIALAPLVPTVFAAGPWMRELPASVRFSVYHRAKIWEFAVEKITQRPLLGWGLDAARAIPGGAERVDINRDLGYERDAGVRFGVLPYRTVAVRMPLHPHDAAMQLWLELGAVGAALGWLAAAAAVRAVHLAALPAADKAARLAAIASTFVVASLSYGIWQSWWQAALWLTAAVLAALPGAQSGSDRRARNPPRGESSSTMSPP